MRIIFLDIDGPIINTPCFSLHAQASQLRRVMSQSALGWVVRLAKECDAHIVTNSAHNFHDVPWQGEDPDNATGPENLKQSLMRFGVPERFFHQNWRTEFPNNYGEEYPRLKAVERWIKANGDTNWVAFDDMPEEYGPSPNVITIDFDEGVTKKHYLMATHRFEFSPEYR